MKLKQIVERVGGSIQGDADLEIKGARGIEVAEEGDITFLTDKKLIAKLADCKASAVIVPKALEIDKAQVIHPNPPLAFAKILAEFHPPVRPAPGVSSQAVIEEGVTLGQNVTICPFVYLGKNVTVGDHTVLYPGVVVGENSRIGHHTVIYPNVTLYHETVIGNHVILHSGTVIGADGFGYAPDEKGQHFKIQQVGRAVIEDHVEIGANSCVDRAAFGETVIKRGTKIDNLVQVAHNCTVGEHSILVAQVGMAGSCKLGHHVILAGQVGLADHVTLGDQVVLAAQSGTHRDILEPGMYGGSPAISGMAWKKYLSVLPNLPEMSRKIKDLEKRLNAIENK